jgi:hypothetical protein
MTGGLRTPPVSCAYDNYRRYDTIVLRVKERIREAVLDSAPMKSTILTKQRQRPIHEMEKLLLMWIKMIKRLERLRKYR